MLQLRSAQVTLIQVDKGTRILRKSAASAGVFFRLQDKLLKIIAYKKGKVVTIILCPGLLWFVPDFQVGNS